MQDGLMGSRFSVPGSRFSVCDTRWCLMLGTALTGMRGLRAQVIQENGKSENVGAGRMEQSLQFSNLNGGSRGDWGAGMVSGLKFWNKVYSFQRDLGAIAVGERGQGA